MGKKLAFICENVDHFLIRSMLGDLGKAGFEVSTYPIDMNAFSFADSPFKIFILYLDGYTNAYNRILSSLGFLANEDKEKHIFLVGTASDIDFAYAHIDRNAVDHAFKRPVQIEDIIRQLNIAAPRYTYEKDNATIGKTAEPRSDRKTILIVDDDEVYLRSMERWFTGEYNVYTAPSPTMTIPILKKIHADLILLDYEMPVLSGLDLFHMLKNEPMTANIPIIFLTAKDDKQTILEVLSAKPTNYLLKTLSPILLQKSVREFFANNTKKK